MKRKGATVSLPEGLQPIFQSTCTLSLRQVSKPSHLWHLSLGFGVGGTNCLHWFLRNAIGTENLEQLPSMNGIEGLLEVNEYDHC